MRTTEGSTPTGNEESLAGLLRIGTGAGRRGRQVSLGSRAVYVAMLGALIALLALALSGLL